MQAGSAEEAFLTQRAGPGLPCSIYTVKFEIIPVDACAQDRVLHRCTWPYFPPCRTPYELHRPVLFMVILREQPPVQADSIQFLDESADCETISHVDISNR